ncbi:MAG: hypothetical protein ACXWQ5_18060 [Ktedonobacterales bacterium]
MGAAVKLGGKVLGKMLGCAAGAADSEVAGSGVMHLMCVLRKVVVGENCL